MPQEEQYGTRDRAYSAWHRRGSTRRYVGLERAQTLSMIDLDASLYVEYDDRSKEPLALIETAMDVGQNHKTATVTKKLARRADLPAFIVLYALAEAPNPADSSWPDIEKFRIRRIFPEPETQWFECSPAAWCRRLVRLREETTATLDAEFEASGT